VTIATPANNATNVSLTTISGTAYDNVGVGRVQFTLWFTVGGVNHYWSGSAWARRRRRSMPP